MTFTYKVSVSINSRSTFTPRREKNHFSGWMIPSYKTYLWPLHRGSGMEISQIPVVWRSPRSHQCLGKLFQVLFVLYVPFILTENRSSCIFPCNTSKKAVYCLNAYSPEAKLLSSTTPAEINFHTHSLFCYFLPKTWLSTTHLQLFTRNYKTY